MQRWQIILLTMILALLLDAYPDYGGMRTTQLPVLAQTMSETANVPPDSCPVTPVPDSPFAAPKPNAPFAPWEGIFWYGSESLWTALPVSGGWSELPHNPEGYTQKIMWWRKGYFWLDEPEPPLVVTGQRLDAPAPPLNVSRATNAFAEDIQSAMLVGVDFPTLGCWEIAGRYHDDELSFVIWVAP